MRRIFSISFSEQCNMDCTYCNVDKHSNEYIDIDHLRVTFQLFRARYPGDAIRVDFHGGEPLIHFDNILLLLEELSCDSNIEFSITTNGLLLKQEHVDIFNQYKVKVTISHDGLWQDTNRPLLSGATSSSRLANIGELIKRLDRVNIHTMVTHGNYNLLENHIHIMSRYNLNPNITLIRDVGVWDVESVSLLKDGITELFRWYVANATVEQIPNFILHYLRHVVLYKSKNTTHNCGAGTTYFSYTGDNILPCNRFDNDEHAIKNLSAFLHMEECAKCDVSDYCTKGCVYEQIKNGKPIEELCNIYKHIYKEVFDMIYTLQSNDKFVSLLREEIRSEITG